MNTCYWAIGLLSVAAALVMGAEQRQECQCVEGSEASLTVHMIASLSNGECGQLTLDSCNLTILCNWTSSLKLVSDESLEFECSNNVPAVLQTSDNRSVDVILECSGDTEAHLKEGTTNNPVLRLSSVCANTSNGTSPATTHPETPNTTTEVGTTESSKNPTAEAGTTNTPAVTTDNPQPSDYSNTTPSSNSSSDTTAEVIPNSNSTIIIITTTTQGPETTTGYAVSFRVCSGLVVMMLAVSSLL